MDFAFRFRLEPVPIATTSVIGGLTHCLHAAGKIHFSHWRGIFVYKWCHCHCVLCGKWCVLFLVNRRRRGKSAYMIKIKSILIKLCFTF